MTSDWRTNLVNDDEGLTRILRESRTVAVLGVKSERTEPAYYVPAYLAAHGYRVCGVNPVLDGHSVLGEKVVAALADLPSAVDLIDVFRRPEYLSAHAAEILALPWKPSAVWFQLGIRNDEAARRLAEAGIRVVQSRCVMPEHRRLLARG